MTPVDMAAGIGLDLLLGDPRWLPHPVRAIGSLVIFTERHLRRSRIPLRLAGGLLWLIVVGVSAGTVALTLPWTNIYWIYAFLAIRSLDTEATQVIGYLKEQNLLAARAQLSTIVGRDTEHLGEPEIIRAAIETLSENLSDGVVAPLLWCAIGGPAAMAAYKAINTLDSMVGYRNERYREFGFVSARMDDLANWIPARLTAVLVCLLAPKAWRIIARDASSQPSPNSGYPEAAFAGALGVQLGGLSTYGGSPSHKATLGDPTRPLDLSVWQDSRRLFYITSLIAAALATGAVAWR